MTAAAALISAAPGGRWSRCVTTSRRMRNNLGQRVDTYRDSCFERKTPPEIKEIALQLGMTRGTLSKKFRALYGVDLTEYFNQYRIARAKHLLAFTSLRIAEVARRAAFGNERTQRRVFRRYTGMSPKAYRKLMKKR